MSLEADILRDKERDSAPPCTEPDYSSYDLIELFQLAKQGDEGAAAELSRRSGARASDFNYELRHPGHADQSVHNPHKGGGAYAPGKWTAVSESDGIAMRRKIAEDVVAQDPYTKAKNADFARQYTKDETARIMKAMDKEQATGDLYVNGNVQARFPKGMSEKQKQHHLNELDENLAYAPKGMLGNKDFPIEVHYGGKGASRAAGRTMSENIEMPTGGATVWVKSDIVKKGTAPEGLLESGGVQARVQGSLTLEDVTRQRGTILDSQLVKVGDSGWDTAKPWDAWQHGGVGKSEAGNVLAHEIGHVAFTFNASTRGRSVEEALVTGAARTSRVSPLSLYSERSGTEYYAELFSVWATSKGKTDRQDVLAAAVTAGWGSP